MDYYGLAFNQPCGYRGVIYFIQYASIKRSMRMNETIIRIVLPILMSMVDGISIELKDTIIDFILDFEERAKKTSNPWDDILAALLHGLMTQLVEHWKEQASKPRK